MIKEQKDKERERRNRGNRKYGQAKQKYAKKGIMSCFIAGVIFLVFLSLIGSAFVHKGTASTFVGGFGLIAVIFTGIGIVTAFRGFRERDKNYLTCKVGLGVNAFLLLSLLLIFIRGFL